MRSASCPVDGAGLAGGLGLRFWVCAKTPEGTVMVAKASRMVRRRAFMEGV